MSKASGGHRNGSPDAADTLTPTRLAEIGGSIPIAQVQELRKIPSALPSLFPPSRVQSYFLEIASPTSLRLTWSTPASNGGSTLLGYKIRVVNQDTGATVYQSATYDSSPFVATGLTTGVSYQVRVAPVNAIGQGEEDYSDSIPGVTIPGAPTGLSATAGDGTAALSWTAPANDGGGAIAGYVVEYTPAGGSAQTSGTGSAGTTFTLNSDNSTVTNGVTYSVRVAATNAAGQGPYSSSVSVTPGVVPGAPTSLSATRGNAQVSLSWTAPENNGGAAITSYTISYSGGSIATGTSSTSATVTGLTNGTLYSFTVAATNSVGTGAASSSASATPATVPSAPTALSGTAGDTQVPLTWTAPASNGGAAITGYVVEWTPAGGSADTVNTGSATASYTKTGLTNGTAYTFRVAAVNSAGTGPYSGSATVTPVAASPTISYLLVGGGGGGRSGGGGGGQVVEGTMVASGPLRLRVGLGGAQGLLDRSDIDYFFISPSTDRRGGTPSILGSISAAGGDLGGTNWAVGGTGNGGATAQSNGTGGSGAVSSLTGLRYGGGGSGARDDGDGGYEGLAGSAGGGGSSYYNNRSGTNGLGGGAGGDPSYGNGGTGGDGVVVLQLSSAAYYISPSLTYTVANNRYTFTAGDGYVTVAQPAPLAVQIPRMTGNTAPSGTVLRFGSFTSINSWQYFGTASDSTGGFHGQPSIGAGDGIGFDFGATNTFSGYYALPHYGGGGTGPSSLTFSGSNDGVNWTVLQTTTFNLSPNSNANSWWRGRDNDGWQWDTNLRNEITAAGSYRFVRWMNTGSGAFLLNKLQLLLPASPALIPSLPGAPTALSGTSATGEIALSWTAPINSGTSALTGYVVEFTPAGGSASTVSTGSTATSYAVSGLTNGTAVTFRVAGVSSVGQGPYSSAFTITPAARLVTLLRGTQASGAAQWGFQHLTGSGTAADPFIVQSGTHDVINFNPVWFISGTATMHIQVPTRLWDDDGTDRQTIVRLRSGSTLTGISSSRAAGTDILTAGVGTYSVSITNGFVRYNRIDTGEYPGEWTGLRIWFTGTTVDTSPLPAGTLLSGAGWTGGGRSSSRLTLSANRGEPWSMPVTAAASGICVAGLLSDDSFNDGNYARMFVNGVLVLSGNGTTNGSFPVISGQVITFSGDVGGVSILQGTTLHLI